MKKQYYPARGERTTRIEVNKYRKYQGSMNSISSGIA
jgi:hypothetical protein